MAEHKCETRLDWLQQAHYMCPCGHVEWAHWPNGQCAHCNCNHYSGEPDPSKTKKEE